MDDNLKEEEEVSLVREILIEMDSKNEEQTHIDLYNCRYNTDSEEERMEEEIDEFRKALTGIDQATLESFVQVRRYVPYDCFDGEEEDEDEDERIMKDVRSRLEEIISQICVAAEETNEGDGELFGTGDYGILSGEPEIKSPEIGKECELPVDFLFCGKEMLPEDSLQERGSGDSEEEMETPVEFNLMSEVGADTLQSFIQVNQFVQLEDEDEERILKDVRDTLNEIISQCVAAEQNENEDSEQFEEIGIASESSIESNEIVKECKDELSSVESKEIVSEEDEMQQSPSEETDNNNVEVELIEFRNALAGIDPDMLESFVQVHRYIPSSEDEDDKDSTSTLKEVRDKLEEIISQCVLIEETKEEEEDELLGTGDYEICTSEPTIKSPDIGKDGELTSVDFSCDKEMLSEDDEDEVLDLEDPSQIQQTTEPFSDSSDSSDKELLCNVEQPNFVHDDDELEALEQVGRVTHPFCGRMKAFLSFHRQFGNVGDLPRRRHVEFRSEVEVIPPSPKYGFESSDSEEDNERLSKTFPSVFDSRRGEGLPLKHKSLVELELTDEEGEDEFMIEEDNFECGNSIEKMLQSYLLKSAAKIASNSQSELSEPDLEDEKVGNVESLHSSNASLESDFREAEITSVEILNQVFESAMNAVEQMEEPNSNEELYVNLPEEAKILADVIKRRNSFFKSLQPTLVETRSSPSISPRGKTPVNECFECDRNFTGWIFRYDFDFFPNIPNSLKCQIQTAISELKLKLSTVENSVYDFKHDECEDEFGLCDVDWKNDNVEFESADSSSACDVDEMFDISELEDPSTTNGSNNNLYRSPSLVPCPRTPPANYGQITTCFTIEEEDEECQDEISFKTCTSTDNEDEKEDTSPILMETDIDFIPTLEQASFDKKEPSLDPKSMQYSTSVISEEDEGSRVIYPSTTFFVSKPEEKKKSFFRRLFGLK